MQAVPVARVASALRPRACAQAWRAAAVGARPPGSAFTAAVPHAPEGRRRRQWWWSGWGAVTPTRARGPGPPSSSQSTRGFSAAARGGGGGAKQRGRKGPKNEGADDQESDEEEPDDEETEGEDDVAEQEGVVKDYKDLDKTVASFRFDLVMKAGLDMSIKKIEDAFYANRLRLNGQRLIKKSRTVREGDVLDLLLPPGQSGGAKADAKPSAAGASRAAEGQSEVPAGTNSGGSSETDPRGGVSAAQGEAVSRLVVLRASDERSPSQRYGVRLRRWKHLVPPPASRDTA